MIRVMLVDDHPLVLEGLRAMMDAERDIQVVATTTGVMKLVEEGRIRLNDANLLMLRQIVRRTLPENEALDFNERVAQLHKAVAGDGGDAVESARAMRVMLDTVMRQVAARSFRPEDLRAMLAGLVRDGLDGAYRDYSGAEQATMAMGSLMGFLGKRGELADMRAANAALDRVYDTVRDDEKYRPERFRAALEELGKTVNR